jgi:hypothetical protein
MDDSLPKIQIVKQSATQALSDLKNNPPGGPVPSSIGAGRKEYPKEINDLQEVPQVPEISREMKEFGVEQVKETVELPQEVEHAGVQHADSLVQYEPPKENLTPNIPLNTQQMQKGLHARVADSLLWLVYWCMRQIKMTKKNTN